jgi:hypothetical protein
MIILPLHYTSIRVMIYHLLFRFAGSLVLIIVSCKSTFRTSAKENDMINTFQQNDQRIQVLELRNYLLKPNMVHEFNNYFSKHFVEPMTELNGHTLGQFQIKGNNDRFVWFRGFTDMDTRSKFLNDFYVSGSSWKEFGPGANAMIINSDNVYLLRPLNPARKAGELSTGKDVTVVDFYICNSTLEKTIDLFNASYLPFLKTLNIEDITLWVTEMGENDFHRLPVFQDKNLLVTISNYENEEEYEAKQKEIDTILPGLKKSMLEIITIHTNLVLINNKTILQ